MRVEETCKMNENVKKKKTLKNCWTAMRHRFTWQRRGARRRIDAARSRGARKRTPTAASFRRYVKRRVVIFTVCVCVCLRACALDKRYCLLNHFRTLKASANDFEFGALIQLVSESPVMRMSTLFCFFFNQVDAEEIPTNEIIETRCISARKPEVTSGSVRLEAQDNSTL